MSDEGCEKREEEASMQVLPLRSNNHGVHNHGRVSGLLGPDRTYLSQWMKHFLAHNLVRLIERALN